MISCIIIGFFVGVTAIFVLPPYFAQDEVILPYLVETGLSYFNGDKLLENQNQPCGECHNIASLGLLGNTLAPDLSKAFLGPPSWFEDIPDFEGNTTKLTNFLRNPPSGTMKLIWLEGPLTSIEVESIVELLIYASSQG
jgi:hypothetical protein|tara:strand:+ start:368 stop:784 length:417 start_codon:yes stop_codon:yes gene_type:complete